MCGRYNVIPNAQAFADAFGVLAGLDALPTEPMWNIAPSSDKCETKVPIVRMGAQGRELVMVHWPLVPFWARGRPVAYSTANAKAETLAEKPVFRGPWQKRRCLIPASGYYEWQVLPGRRTKQPHHIRLHDTPVFAFGGLWETSRTDAGEAVESCAVVTTPPAVAIAHIHNRMPLILPPAAYEDWLTGTAEAAGRLLVPYPGAELEAYAIGTAVNNPLFNDPRCIEPAAA